ncbi:hypothetical protein RFI_01591 [Reticulomyxa filosa]|uniref:Uncharacterized protein n=1 Tax=Reticulomyxa filosa TaxID=46433 RepID=X6PCT0_RETFI|nr:hypothetical protein RFI_01591 [Reticulomyxa filosa]|eukprot:ETO35472.1 hypothetical protein RFI_01591 [Reticulomyxa filosa]
MKWFVVEKRPCISDMTLEVDKELMPVIRSPNYSDETWDVSIDKIAMVVGNEKKEGKLKTVPLKEYLEHFDQYMSKPSFKGPLNLLANDSTNKQKDSHVIMSSQACFLPVQQGHQTKFSVALYNYQSTLKNPKVLVIVCTSKGSSAQIIQGSTQTLYFNNQGKKGPHLQKKKNCEYIYIVCKGTKAQFVAQRLSDNRHERGVNLEGEMSKEERQNNVVTIIQVPLKQKEERRAIIIEVPSKQKAQCKWSRYQLLPRPVDSRLGSVFIEKEEEDLDVEAAIVKVSKHMIPITPKCNKDCKKELVLKVLRNRKMCSECSKSVDAGSPMWRCPENGIAAHKWDYYYLCEICGTKQLEWNELNDINDIERDTKFPIRVVVQFYQATSNGQVNSSIMSAIAHMLKASQQQADFVGSLVTHTNPDRPTEWIEQKNNENGDDDNNNEGEEKEGKGNDNGNGNGNGDGGDDSGNIIAAKVISHLQKIFGEDWKSYFLNFQTQPLDNATLKVVDKTDDLTKVLDKST